MSPRLLSIIQYGKTGLMIASENDARDVVGVLLEAKADPNIITEVKLLYSHCLYNSNLMYRVTGWMECSLPGCQEGSCRSSQDVGEVWCSCGHQKEGN